MTNSALLIVDVQYDFLPGGALAIPGGDRVIPVINQLIKARQWTCICATQDYHPRDHISFASNHPGHPEMTEVSWHGMVQEQRLWPVHCVQGTKGCELHEDLLSDRIDKVFQKGYNSKLDSYSGFADSFNHEETGLNEYLQEKDVRQIYVVGLAEDFCVLQTALAAGKLGYKTMIVTEAVAGIDLLSAEQESQLSDAAVFYTSLSDVLSDTF